MRYLGPRYFLKWKDNVPSDSVYEGTESFNMKQMKESFFSKWGKWKDDFFWKISSLGLVNFLKWGTWRIDVFCNARMKIFEMRYIKVIFFLRGGTAYCIWSIISSISSLNRWSSSQGLFCHVPLKRDQWDWDWRLSWGDTPHAIGCTSECRGKWRNEVNHEEMMFFETKEVREWKFEISWMK